MTVLREQQAGTVRIGVLLVLLAIGGGALALFFGAQPRPTSAAVFSRPTNSSPIVLNASNTLLWVVNPRDNSVSVLRTDTNAVVTKITVGEEPQSVAVDPDDTFAYVANAVGGTVSVIKIINAAPGNFQAQVDRTLLTGAEPWNITISPNGKRVFVANSGQDTVTVIDANARKIVGHVDLRNSLCNDPDRNRHFQPRGLAVTQDSTRLYVTRFLSFVKAGGIQGTDTGHEGAVCRLDIDTASLSIGAYAPTQLITLAARDTGFQDSTPAATSAFPNQLQSIVIRGNVAFLPNVAASPSGPLRFDNDTHAFVNRIDGVNGAAQTDLGALNLHLGARDPSVLPKLFFANPWAMAFTNQSGAGFGYVVSAGSDLLVKVKVDAAGLLDFTVDFNTTARIDLNDPANPDTSGANAGKNPRGIAINDAGTKAYVMNFVSRNVSIVNLTTDEVTQVVQTFPLPAPGSAGEITLVGAEMFFSSRGHFDRPAGALLATSTDNRLSQSGWQNCASCHPEGLSDGVVWTFGTGPRKSVPLNTTFDPDDPNNQRVLNYSAIFDEIEDFEANIRNVSGPGNSAGIEPCANPGPTGNLRVNNGLLFGDDGDINKAPCTVNAFGLANANRQQLTVTLPGSGTAVPALTALRQWVRLAVRTPNGPLHAKGLPSGIVRSTRISGRNLFETNCAGCHGGPKWTRSTKDFTSPPSPGDVKKEVPPTLPGTDPVGNEYLARFLVDIGSFNLGVAGQGNLLGNNIGAVEKATGGKDALGRDYNGDNLGNGYNVPSLLGIHASPPYYHNGACETLACVLSNINHVGTTLNAKQIAALIRFLESIDDETPLAFQHGRRTP